MIRVSLISILLFFCSAGMVAQVAYSYEPDPKHPEQLMLLGPVTKYLLRNDPSFSWYAANQKGYDPSVKWLSALEKAKDSLSFVVFGGTWCEDSQFILPRFFRLLEKAGFPDERVHFYAVDRNKKTPDGKADTYRIERVPTIIVLASGKELGRVVEYGTTGKWDEEVISLLR